MSETSKTNLLAKAKSFANKHKGLCWIVGGLAVASNPVVPVAGLFVGAALYCRQVWKDDPSTLLSHQAATDTAQRDTASSWNTARVDADAQKSNVQTAAAQASSQPNSTTVTRIVCAKEQTAVKSGTKKQKTELNKDRLAEQVNAYIARIWDWVSFSDVYAIVVDDEGTEYVVYFDPATSTVLNVEEAQPHAESGPTEGSLSAEQETQDRSAAEEIAKKWFEDNEHAIYCLFLESEGDDVLISAGMLPEERQAWPFICKGLEAYCDKQKKIVKSGDQIIVCG